MADRFLTVVAADLKDYLTATSSERVTDIYVSPHNPGAWIAGVLRIDSKRVETLTDMLSQDLNVDVFRSNFLKEAREIAKTQLGFGE